MATVTARPPMITPLINDATEGHQPSFSHIWTTNGSATCWNPKLPAITGTAIIMLTASVNTRIKNATILPQMRCVAILSKRESFTVFSSPEDASRRTSETKRYFASPVKSPPSEPSESRISLISFQCSGVTAVSTSERTSESFSKSFDATQNFSRFSNFRDAIKSSSFFRFATRALSPSRRAISRILSDEILAFFSIARFSVSKNFE